MFSLLRVLFFIFSLGTPAFAYSGVAYYDVDSNVRGATVSLNGRFAGYTPCRVEVSTGTWYDIEVRASGYITETHRDCRILSDGHVERIYANLRRAATTGSLSVKTGNVSGASVYLDGTFKGYTPLTIQNVREGTHSVRVSKRNCKDETASVYVAAGETASVNLSMKISQISVRVTNVNGVGIYLDGVYKGTAPLVISDIPSGYHLLRAAKGNFDDETFPFHISDGESKSATFTMKTAGLEVRSNVPGADVYIDGERKGTSPTTIRDLEPGPHTVRISKTHYQTKTENIRLTGGYISTKDFYLEKISGYLSVRTSPADATVKINGKEISKNEYEIDEGTYTIVLSAFGYQELTDTVYIERDRYTVVDEFMDVAPFRISSFSTSVREFNPNNKHVHNEIRFLWSVNGPESGWIDISDSSGINVGSIDVYFDTWTGSAYWDGKLNGEPLHDGTYTATLKGGGVSRSVNFTINSRINDYDQESKGPGIYFNVGPSLGPLFGGADFGLDICFGGKNIYGGLGLFGTIFMDKNSPSYNPDTTVLGGVDFFVGGSYTFYMARPFLQAGIGYYMSSGAKGASDSLPRGFFFEGKLGCDFIFDKFSIGGFYARRYFQGIGWTDSVGATIGISFD